MVRIRLVSEHQVGGLLSVLLRRLSAEVKPRFFFGSTEGTGFLAIVEAGWDIHPTVKTHNRISNPALEYF